MTTLRTDELGIASSYHDAFGEEHRLSPTTHEAIRAAMRLDTLAPDATGARVVRPGDPIELRGELILESGARRRLSSWSVPSDLPLGYHQLQADDSSSPTRLIVAPRQCCLPPELRGWGLAVQLYATRSSASWGIGDLGDLGQLGRWGRELGACMALINPLHAVAPLPAQQPSPYYPSSRRFLNPLYLRVEEVPGARDADMELERLAALGRELNSMRQIDRDAVFRLKLRALERLWERFAGDARFDAYCEERGAELSSFVSHCVLVEHFGADWRKWQAPLRDPRSGAVSRFSEEHDARRRFHAWLQWLLDEQLARAGAELMLFQDLPIGVDPAGADAWVWQDVLAQGVSAGAPPDRYNAEGQNWGLPPFVPQRLRAAGYQPFIETMRAALRHSGGLRIDHVMGLFRLFWIPEGRSPREGAYVYYPADDLLGILALESQRAGAVIVGEDLGTVEPGVRERLAAQGILSYRLLWFEEGRPSSYPELALAAVTTHDLPTIAGLWTGADLEEQRSLGLQVNEGETRRIRDRLATMAGLREDAALAEVIRRTHGLLAEAPSRLVSVTVEDLCLAERRPNLPGTCDERPNWRHALRGPLEELTSAPLPRQVAEMLSRRGAPRRGGSSPG